jgi:hypothetical protein
MPTDRRYTEKEISAIFEKAASAQRSADDHPSADKGLTLAELQKIGAEAGISAEFVTRAAAELDRTSGTGSQTETFLGLPLSAFYQIDIPDSFNDDDWDRLVVDLRQTFQARGEISQDGSLREWRNGNLYALIEPTSNGVRLRMGTRKVEPKGMILGGLGWFLFWLMIGILKLAEAGFDPTAKVVFLSIMAVLGLGMSATVAAGLPKWSRKRQHQMEDIARRTLEARPFQPEAKSTEAHDRVGSPDGQSKQAATVSRVDIPDDSTFEPETGAVRSRPRSREVRGH